MGQGVASSATYPNGKTNDDLENEAKRDPEGILVLASCPEAVPIELAGEDDHGLQFEVISDQKLIIAHISPGLAEEWNKKGDERWKDRCYGGFKVCAGQEVIEVNGAKDLVGMRAALAEPGPWKLKLAGIFDVAKFLLQRSSQICVAGVGTDEFHEFLKAQKVGTMKETWKVAYIGKIEGLRILASHGSVPIQFITIRGGWACDWERGFLLEKEFQQRYCMSKPVLHFLDIDSLDKYISSHIHALHTPTLRFNVHIEGADGQRGRQWDNEMTVVENFVAASLEHLGLNHFIGGYNGSAHILVLSCKVGEPLACAADLEAATKAIKLALKREWHVMTIRLEDLCRPHQSAVCNDIKISVDFSIGSSCVPRLISALESLSPEIAEGVAATIHRLAQEEESVLCIPKLLELARDSASPLFARAVAIKGLNSILVAGKALPCTHLAEARKEVEASAVIAEEKYATKAEGASLKAGNGIWTERVEGARVEDVEEKDQHLSEAEQKYMVAATKAAQDDFADAQKTIVDLKETMKEKDETIARQEQYIKERDASIQKLTDQIKELAHEIDR